jgi:hypothetical protein
VRFVCACYKLIDPPLLTSFATAPTHSTTSNWSIVLSSFALLCNGTEITEKSEWFRNLVVFMLGAINIVIVLMALFPQVARKGLGVGGGWFLKRGTSVQQQTVGQNVVAGDTGGGGGGGGDGGSDEDGDWSSDSSDEGADAEERPPRIKKKKGRADSEHFSRPVDDHLISQVMAPKKKGRADSTHFSSPVTVERGGSFKKAVVNRLERGGSFKHAVVNRISQVLAPDHSAPLRGPEHAIPTHESAEAYFGKLAGR